MDWLKIGSRTRAVFDKYKYVLLVIALGVLLMVMPLGEQETAVKEEPVQTQQTAPMEEKLVKILSQIKGVGKVQVMITEQTGSETVYQVDEDRTEGEGSLSTKKETVMLSGGGKQSGLVRTVTPPTYLGAVIVCQGGSSPQVRLAVSDAVSAVTGLSMDRISVLEMK